MTRGAPRRHPEPTGPAFSRSLWWAAAIPAAALFVPLLVPLFMGRVFSHMDIGVFHLPLRHLYSDALAHGDSIIWTSRMFSGFYIHGEGQIGAFHPLHLVLYRLLPLATAFSVELVLWYAFAWAGMWLFLRRVGLHAASSAVGAIAFAFSGFFLLHMGHPNAIAVTSHIPWLLVGLDLTLAQAPASRSIGVAAIAGMTGSQVLLGYPQYVWMSILVCLVYGLSRAWDRLSRRRLFLATLAGTAGLAIGGIQLLPTFDLLSQSQRAVTGREFQLSLSLHPFNLVQVWSPYALPARIYAPANEFFVHEFGIYNGAFCALAIAWTFVRRRELPFPHAARFAGVLCVTGLILALGRYGFVYEQLAALPVVGSFRAPTRHLLLVQLGLAVLAAITFEDLIRVAGRTEHAPRPSRWLKTPLMLAAATTVAGLAWWIWISPVPKSPAYPAALLTGAALMAVGTTLMRDASRGVPAALLILPTFLAMDLGFWGYSYAWGTPPQTLESIAATPSSPPSETPPASVHYESGDGTVNYWLLRDARVMRPYVGLFPRLRLRPGEATLRLAGVEWVKGASGWRRVEDPMPRARIVAEARASDDAAADLPSIDIVHTALVEHEISKALASPGDVSIQLIEDRPGRLTFQVTTPKPALLSLTESYHAGWTASADGRRMQTLRLYGDFLGVILETGSYGLTLAFEPRSVAYGLYLTLSGILATVALTLAARKPWRE